MNSINEPLILIQEALNSINEPLSFIKEALNSINESLILVQQYFRLVAWLSEIAIAIIHPKAHPKPKNLDMH
ncbi:MAG: hypothetical protein HWQ41_03165 [Nostoc sp. NOS(2021)]|uniref:hypothetical protein n=1 Tax=Nostoc sp. NOS(2021) TaxID=2815407 RepID=UPI0025D05C9C|nr:hypothetical protein [Nostoc sp. NOS(2021)]MBN3894293.1 hypothetical protein [Nostoc sp. NOS(2021)]